MGHESTFSPRLLVSSIKVSFLLANTSLSVGFPCGSAGKESACKAGDLGSIPGLGRSPGEGKDYPLQYSGLENSGLVLWPRKLHSPWGCKESDTIEQLSLSLFVSQYLILEQPKFGNKSNKIPMDSNA